MRSAAGIGLLMFLGCSSATRKEEHRISGVFLYNLQVRRPPTVGADPKAYLGDREYESHPSPNSRFDCQSYGALFKDKNLQTLRSCFSELNTGPPKTFSYLLFRDAAPYLRLERNDEKAPLTCLDRYLSEIPVPREIFFQSSVEGRVGCYSARMEIREDEWLGIRSWLHSSKLKVVFPIQKLPRNDAETLMLLGSWSIALFQEESRLGVPSRVVPEEICRKCYEDKNLLHEGEPLPPLWSVSQ